MTGESLFWRKGSWIAMVLVLAVVCVCFAVVTGTLQIDRVDPFAGSANLSSLCRYAFGFFVLWVLLGVFAWRLNRSDRQGHSWCSGRSDIFIIVGVAIVVRVVAISGGGPQLSNDLWRYIHDGRRLAAGFNPYGQSPLDLGAGSGHDSILDQINHPQLVTIYQPTSQLVFAGLWFMHSDRFDPLAVKTFQLGFIGIDLIIIGLLLGELRRQGRSPWWAILYAWHPLAISETAATGHQDVVGIVMLLLALVLTRPSAISLRRAVAAGAVFAAAVAVKPIMLPLALPLAWALRQRRYLVVAAAVSAFVMVLVFYLPFVFSEGALRGMIETIGVFSSRWSFNGSLQNLIVWAIGSVKWANVSMALLLMAVLGASMWCGHDRWQTTLVFLLTGLLFSSTVYPWYLLWVLVIVPIRFDLSVWLFSFTIIGGYVVLGHMQQWQVPWWILIVEYVPVYACLIWTVLRSQCVRSHSYAGQIGQVS